MRLQLLPVYSRLATEDLLKRVLRGRRLPATMELREHQALTLEALEDPTIDIVTNTAMTGDGKSLAAYLRVLIGSDDGFPRTVLGLYPTIELSKDQQEQFRKYQEMFQTSLTFESVWGTRLTELAEGGFGGRAHALLSLLRNHEIVLTNPDIFARMMNFQYQSGIFTRQEMPWTAITHFHLLLFDEFHLFSMPQFASAVTALAYAQEMAQQWRPKALFSSATQHPSLLGLIQRAGLRQKVIAGAYATVETPGYRPILHPADLHIHQLATDQNAESWLAAHTQLIEDAWRTASGPEPRIAVIVSSIAAARRIANLLRERFAASTLKPGGLKISEITGLTRGSLDADIVVGTSTIDVGVDFHISMLIFEAANAGQFLQRLGRLGRFHGEDSAFSSYSAHALISAKTPWISQRIEAYLRDAGIHDGDAVERPTTLREAIEASYPSETDFEPYGHRWGVLQGYHTIHTLQYGLRESGDAESAYETPATNLDQRYAQLFGWKDLRAVKRLFYGLKKKGNVEGEALLDEVLSFRGSSPFQVALVDASQQPLSKDSFTPYDLFFVLQATRWQLLPEEEFLRQLRTVASSEDVEKQKREFQWVLRDKHDQMLCMRITDFLEERESLILGLDRRVEDEHLLDRALATKGFSVEEPRAGGAQGLVNNILVRQRVVCYITERTIPELRRLHLPALFPLYRLKEGANTYTVVFGKPALMLDSLLRTRRRARHPPSDDRPIFDWTQFPTR